MPTTRRAFLAQAAAPAFLAAQARRRPPNILYIICDQMRGDAMGCVGHPNVRTPNLDRMAAQGVLFERCFVNNPVCLPSRQSAFTGRYPHQHGALTNQGKTIREWSGTLVETFQKAGYRTGWVGKNHTYGNELVGNLDYASIRDREPFRDYNGMVPPYWHTDVYWPEDKCYPEINTQEALRFLDGAQSGGEPFFLHVSYFDPHPPYMAPAEFTQHYSGREMRLPDYVDPNELSGRLAEFKDGFGMENASKADLTETMRYYLAQIEWGVDKQVGRLLQGLADRGLAENTVVVFTADHGDFMGSYGLVRKGMFLYDALLHVPMIWYAPGRIPAGKRTKAQAQHIDLFPTLADFAGLSTSGLDLPGRSLKPLIEGGADDPRRPIFTSAGYDELTPIQINIPVDPGDEATTPRHSMVMNHNMGQRYKTSMVRTPEWKMVMTETRGPELYAMNGGVVEKKNVADKKEHAGVRRKLEKELDGFWKW
ncbi:MAG: sulfatase-like hydrolase/transferase [Acidobacteria bacterium]|nr:sulfatase-like hydrolase/transferase [Acidobacteriota bacterium]